MKPFHSFAMLAAIAAVGQAFAVDATTTPVGYTTATIKSAFSPSSPKNNFVALPLVNAASWTGTISAKAGDVLTLNVGSTPLTAGAFNNISASFPGSTVYAYYLEGSDGYWAHINVNATGSVTVQTGAGANFTVNETVTIRRHRTVSDVFGATNQAGLQGDPGGDPNAADNISIIDENNGGNVGIFVAPGVIPGALYVDASYNDADDYPIYPDQGLQVLRRGGSDLTVVSSGEVHNRATQIGIDTGFQIRPIVLPTAVALKDLNLYTGNIATGLAPTSTGDLNEADGLSIVTNGSSTSYFYSTVDLGSGPGWYNDSFAFVNNDLLPAGTVLNINRNNPTNHAPFVWVNPAPTIAP